MPKKKSLTRPQICPLLIVRYWSILRVRNVPCQRRVLSQLKKPFVRKGRRRSHEQGDGRGLIQVIPYNLATYLKFWWWPYLMVFNLLNIIVHFHWNRFGLSPIGCDFDESYSNNTTLTRKINFVQISVCSNRQISSSSSQCDLEIVRWTGPRKLCFCLDTERMWQSVN